MKPTKQTVYLPVKVENDATFLITKEMRDYLNSSSSINFYKNGECVYTPSFITKTTKESEGLEHLIIERLNKKELFVFTSEQLNEYTTNIIKQALETAAQNAEVKVTENALIEDGSCYTTYDDGVISVTSDKQSIINTFEETFKKFSVE